MRAVQTAVAAMAIQLAAVPVHAEDYAGDWLATVTQALTQCEDVGTDLVGEYRLAIVQDKDRLLMQGLEERGATFVGALSPNDPTRASLQPTYDAHGGYVSEHVDLAFTDADTGKGGAVFRWSGALYGCGGSYLFTLRRR